jgi:hypothetical protein
MEPHSHANPELRDLDDDDPVRPGLVGEWHLAYRLGPLGEDDAAGSTWASKGHPAIGRGSCRTVGSSDRE